MINFIPFVLLYFLGFWLLSFKKDKYSWIDFAWSSGFLILIAYVFLTFSQISLETAVLLGMYSLWALRLSYLLLKRVLSEDEDGRYKELKSRWGRKTPWNFLLLYIFEALLVPILALPLFLGISSKVGVLSWVGVALFIVGLVGESISDFQMSKFKRKNRGVKKVCDIGLWKYSRHPNYFFELVIWFSMSIYGFSVNGSALSILPFVVMCLFILKFTGVPYSELQSLRSRGDLYRKYQDRTSVLIPWKPKDV